MKFKCLFAIKLGGVLSRTSDPHLLLLSVNFNIKDDTLFFVGTTVTVLCNCGNLFEVAIHK
jgi:hypothetical protein